MILLPTAFGLQTASAKEISHVEKVKAGIQQRGVGEKARLEVKLRDNTKLKGYVSEAREASFTLVEHKTGASHTVAYTDVARVGGGALMSNRTKAIIGISAGVAAVIVLYTVRGAFCDGQC